MAPRSFVSRFVSGCHRSAGCGLQDMGNGTSACGHGPLKGRGYPVVDFRMRTHGFCTKVLLGCVLAQLQSL